MRDLFLFLGGLLGASGVVLGAFGAHGLKDRLGDSISTWETAVLYHLVHALLLVAIGICIRVLGDSGMLRGAGYAALFGVLAFSGSLYWLALDGPRWLGPVTPLGGLGFIAAWSMLAVAAWQTTD